MGYFIKTEACGSNQRHWLDLTFQFQICLCLIRGQQWNYYDKDFVLGCICLLKLKSLWNGDADSMWSAGMCKLCNILKKLSSIIFLLCCSKEFQILARYSWKGVLLIKDFFSSKHALRQSSCYFFCSVPALYSTFINM